MQQPSCYYCYCERRRFCVVILRRYIVLTSCYYCRYCHFCVPSSSSCRERIVCVVLLFLLLFLFPFLFNFPLLSYTFFYFVLLLLFCFSSIPLSLIFPFFFYRQIVGLFVEYVNYLIITMRDTFISSSITSKSFSLLLSRYHCLPLLTCARWWKLRWKSVLFVTFVTW